MDRRRKLSLTGMQLFCVTLLLASGLFLTGCQGIQSAARDGDIEHIKTLLALGTNVDNKIWGGDQGTALHWAAGAGQTETVEFLIERGADVNISNEASAAPLEYAVRSGHAEIAKILLDNGADVEGKCSGTDIKIPLVAAVHNGDIQIAKILLSHGADVNHGRGATPLHLSLIWKNYEMAKFLLEKGADVNIAKHGGLAPLHDAVKNGNMEMVKLLVGKGANVNAEAKREGYTPLNYARDEEIKTYLISHGAKEGGSK
jgi:ankyrin repeat protein